MTEACFERMLTAALFSAADRDGRQAAAWLREHPVAYTPEFAQRLHRLYEDPFGFAKRALRPHWKGVLRTVLIAAALTALLLAGALAVSPALRAWVVNWLTYQETTHTTHVFENPAYGESGYTFENLPDNVRPGWLPEGYEEINCVDLQGFVAVTYENEQGERLLLQYQTMGEDAVFQTNSQYHTVTETVRNGMQLQIAETQRPGKNGNYILWVNEPMNVAFYLFGYDEIDVLLTIMDSVPAIF